MKTSHRTRLLLGGTAAISLLAAGAARGQEVNAGGSTLASPTYENAFSYFVSTDPTADFLDFYNPSGSGAAQQALVSNASNVSGGAVPFDLGASDATANDAQQVDPNGFVPNPTGGVLYYAWDNPSNAAGKSAAGDLIIIPSIGTPITVPFNIAGVSSNSAINLSDADLCGIYSGAITNTNQLAGTGVPQSNSPITVAYRFDGSGTSFLFTQHLAAVCPATNGPDNIRFTATTSFASLFPNGTPPSNFKSGTGSPGVQSVIESNPNSFGYLSPDYTKIITNPTLGAGVAAAPYVAEVKGVQPTPGNTSAALAQGVPVTDTTLNPGRTPYNPNDPNSFVPVASAPTAGYAIVGYTTLWAPQCYADANVAAAVRGFVSGLYRTAAIIALEQASGFTPVPGASAARVTAAYLSTTSATGINGGRAGDCAGFAGR